MSGWLLVDDRSGCRCSCTKGLVLSPARLNFAPPCPTLHQKPIQELVKKLERSDVIRTSHNCRAEPAYSLSHHRSWSHSGQQTYHKLLKEATGMMVKFGPEMVPSNIVQSCQYLRSRKKMLFTSCRKLGLTWGQVLVPLIHRWQQSIPLDLLQKVVDETLYFSERVIPMNCCCRRLNKILAAESETYIIEMATEPPSPTVWCDAWNSIKRRT